jgi:hypothetical protein
MYIEVNTRVTRRDCELDLGIDRRITLKWITQKPVDNEFMWLRTVWRGEYL